MTRTLITKATAGDTVTIQIPSKGKIVRIGLTASCPIAGTTCAGQVGFQNTFQGLEPGAQPQGILAHLEVVTGTGAAVTPSQDTMILDVDVPVALLQNIYLATGGSGIVIANIVLQS